MNVNASVRTNNLSFRHQHGWHPSHNHRRLRCGRTSRQLSPSTRTNDGHGRTSGRVPTHASRQCSRATSLVMHAQFATDSGTARTRRVVYRNKCRLSHRGTILTAWPYRLSSCRRYHPTTLFARRASVHIPLA
jgi:hypothetical protein